MSMQKHIKENKILQELRVTCYLNTNAICRVYCTNETYTGLSLSVHNTLNTYCLQSCPISAFSILYTLYRPSSLYAILFAIVMNGVYNYIICIYIIVIQYLHDFCVGIK